MKISVIIPSYKPQSYIWECLDSLCSQTFPKEEYEVILVLNGCKEPYDGQIREYINNHPNVQWNYIQTDQGGVSNARNIALDVAKGEYVTFIDDDDYISQIFLESLYKKADSGIIVLSNVYAFDDGTPEIQRQYRITDSYKKLKNDDRIYHPRSRKFFSGPCMKLIPMSFIQGRRFDTKFKNGEDSLFMFQISDKFGYVTFANEDAIYYRRYREQSAVTVKRSKKSIVKNEINLLGAMLRIYIPRFWTYNFKFAMGTFLSTIHGMVEK